MPTDRARRATSRVPKGTAERRKIVARKVSALLLDPENPRLALDSSPTQEALVRALAEPGDLDELANSFARNGYFWEEPLVVVPGRRRNQFIVVEGNRRLATLKLLLDDRLRTRVRPANFPALGPARRKELLIVPTVSYESRPEVIPYLGFRHITGVKKWEPFAKSRYVGQLVEAGHAMTAIEQMVGDSASTVRKLYQQYVVYRQIRDETDSDVNEVRNSYSLLEVLLGQQPIKSALGLPRALPDAPTDVLVPSDRLDVLAQIVSWTFGNSHKNEPRVIQESRDIPKKLAPVVADPSAYEYLKRYRDLEGAYDRSAGEQQFLLKQLVKATRAVERALTVVPLHKNDPGVREEIIRLKTLVDSLYREVNE